MLRDLQTHFVPSKSFAPLLEQERRRREAQDRDPHQRRRRRNLNDGQVKMGHGGTLDPLATGVLIVGVGSGTKQLQNFLGCTKTYETVVLFGKSTDTYDVAGKIVASAPYEHITKEFVEEKLAKFRGKITQVPPIYSAIKIQGMKAYDYARTGKELPRDIAARDMEVADCKMLEWYEGRKHEYRWPAEEALEEEKEVASKLLEATNGTAPSLSNGQKRKSSLVDEADADHSPTTKRVKVEADADEHTSGKPDADPEAAKAAEHTHVPPPPSSLPSPAPATLISLTVSSGFYVRSFAHDLGLACSSLGIMASLVRSRQGAFTLEPDFALTYADLEAGEGVWGPKIAGMLQRWKEEQSHEEETKPRMDDRDQYSRDRGRKGGRRHEEGFSAKRGFGSSPPSNRRTGFDGADDQPIRRGERRNTSSGEE